MKPYTEEDKNRVALLRFDGLTAREIEKITGISKTTVGNWIKRVPISRNGKERLKKHRLQISQKGARNGSKRFKEIRDEHHKIAFNKGVQRTKSDNMFNIICSLYWGEGGKTRRCFVLVNSDPKMIKLVTSWLILQNYDYKVVLRLHNNGETEQQVLDFWKKYLIGVKEKNIAPISWKRAANSKRKMLMGCAYITVQNALFHSEIMGGIEGLQKLDQTIKGLPLYG